MPATVPDTPISKADPRRTAESVPQMGDSPHYAGNSGALVPRRR